MRLCEERGFVKPTWCQGLYNAFNRGVEPELLPVLRENGVRFVAYNPLAAGLLTGKHSASTDVPQGRFKNNPNYLDRFYKPDHFSALAQVRSACEAEGVPLVAASFRWLIFHSGLGPEDGVLIGASTLAQLEENLVACEEPSPLPSGIVSAFDAAWGEVAPDAFKYWRSYSLDMPGRDALDPGATYTAAK
jgi:aflatoxin B1 aldehyde reductase